MVRKRMVGEVDRPQPQSLKGLPNGCGRIAPIELKSTSIAPPAPDGSNSSAWQHVALFLPNGSIFHTDECGTTAPNSLSGKAAQPFPPQPPLSLVVRSGSKPRTVAKHRNGLSPAETRLLSDAAHFMRRGGARLIWIVVEAHDQGELAARKLFDRVKSDFGQMQRRANSQRFYLELLEATGGVHSNIVGALPPGLTARAIARRLATSRVYGPNVRAQAVTDLERLVGGYFLKEATPEAHFAAHRSFRRNKGSHPLGAGGGDRVRLSRDLERAMFAAGAMQKRQRTYRARSLEAMGQKPARRFNVVEGGQLTLFDAKPVSRLRQYGGGSMPKAVALEVRFHLKRLDMTQDDLARAALLGRPTITNALEGRFPLSEWAARRVRETLLAGRAAA